MVEPLHYVIIPNINQILNPSSLKDSRAHEGLDIWDVRWGGALGRNTNGPGWLY